MSNANLLVADVQSLEISSPLVSLFELEYDADSTLYFHPGLSSDVRITNINGATLTLNSSQDLTVGTTLTFSGLDTAGSAVSVTKTVAGGNPDINTLTLNNTSSLHVGMTLTGPGITTTDYSPIVFDGNTYYALPMEMTDFEVKSDGAHARPTLAVGNVESILRTSSVFQNGDDGGSAGLTDFSMDKLIGKRIVKRQTLEKYLTLDPTAVSTKAIVEYPKRSYILDSVKQKTENSVVFELANPFDLQGIKLPRRQIIGKYCPWAYQGLSFSTPSGACSWNKNGEVSVDDAGTERKYYIYFTDLDEPIVWKYVIHNSNNTIQSGKTHPGNTSSSFAIDALVALSDGSGGYTYWRSETASNTTVPSATNSAWQQVRVYVPYVSGTTFSTHATDALRSDYVVYPVNNAGSVADASFDFTATSTVYKVTSTNNSVAPTTPSNYWIRGDQCGKLLNSCKIRYQAKNTTGSANANQNTIPLVELDTIQALPYGGFPGSRKI
jgi:lambda family phage minor tail protein L